MHELEDVFRNKLQIYLKEKRNDIGEDSLTYWKTKSARLIHMAELARRFHCAPPGSAASECAFNTAKDVLVTKRLSLKPANFESLMFLKYNLRALSGDRRPLLKIFHHLTAAYSHLPSSITPLTVTRMRAQMFRLLVTVNNCREINK